MQRTALLPAFALMLGLTGCAEAQAPTTVSTRSGAIAVTTVAKGLEHPWGVAVLPDSRLLVSERPGRLRLVSADGTLSAPLAGVPEVFAQGQGGLLDVALDPAFTQNRLVYLSYAEAGEGGAGTAVARGQLRGNALRDMRVIFRQRPKVSGDSHFGSRLAFAPDGTLFVGLGERFAFAPAQDLASHLGKVVRIRPDGTVPDDNPFVRRTGARPEIWSYGHRNIQAAAIHPRTGALWVIEHGPRGGDEINIAEAGRNYGWPLVSHGRHYNLRDIPDPDTRPDLAQAIWQWTPVIAPSGMLFYDGPMFPQWQGDLLVGGLVAKALVRVEQEGRSAHEAERIALGARIRDVAQGLDGALYVITDEPDGRILRLTRAP